MILVHSHPYVSGGPSEADGVPTCKACGLPPATPTTAHANAVWRYGRPGQGFDAAVPTGRLLGGQGRAPGHQGVATVPARADHPNATPRADRDRGAMVIAQRGDDAD